MLGLYHGHLGHTWRLGREHGLKKCQSCADCWEHKFENLILLLLAGANNSDPAARFCSDLISIGHCTEERAANTNELISRRRSSIVSEMATQKLSSDSVWQKLHLWNEVDTWRLLTISAPTPQFFKPAGMSLHRTKLQQGEHPDFPKLIPSELGYWAPAPVKLPQSHSQSWTVSSFQNCSFKFDSKLMLRFKSFMIQWNFLLIPNSVLFCYHVLSIRVFCIPSWTANMR